MHKKEEDGVDMETVYQEYAQLVYRFLYSHTHDADWSQELMQETFLRAVDSVSRYDGSCKLSVWLCQIAKHILWQELRRKKRVDLVELTEELPDTSNTDGETSVIHKESTQALYHAIHLLPEMEKEVVLYRMTGDLSFRQIGEILGKSENWSRTVFYRAKQKIRKELEKYEL
ncbi:MAG: sigma-70 family RNA polymerase sigma factor [Lachnospiraceae bacterium]|nr:sigma-70 family RNA polymerase sigma factor [Lachnospiraceae bacterium]MDE7203225.1 sigma-70 family RNA polymerase sigma factor [Lachnospiraceae bacterium]